MGEERGPRGGGSACSARFEAMKPSYTACSSCEQNPAPRGFSGLLGVGAGSVGARQSYLAALDLHLSDAIDLNRKRMEVLRSRPVVCTAKKKASRARRAREKGTKPGPRHLLADAPVRLLCLRSRLLRLRAGPLLLRTKTFCARNEQRDANVNAKMNERVAHFRAAGAPDASIPASVPAPRPGARGTHLPQRVRQLCHLPTARGPGARHRAPLPHPRAHRPRRSPRNGGVV